MIFLIINKYVRKFYKYFMYIFIEDNIVIGLN